MEVESARDPIGIEAELCGGIVVDDAALGARCPAQAPGEEHDTLDHLLFDGIRRRERGVKPGGEFREIFLALFAANDVAGGEAVAQRVLRGRGLALGGPRARAFLGVPAVGGELSSCWHERIIRNYHLDKGGTIYRLTSEH